VEPGIWSAMWAGAAIAATLAFCTLVPLHPVMGGAALLVIAVLGWLSPVAGIVAILASAAFSTRIEFAGQFFQSLHLVVAAAGFGVARHIKSRFAHRGRSERLPPVLFACAAGLVAATVLAATAVAASPFPSVLRYVELWAMVVASAIVLRRRDLAASLASVFVCAALLSGLGLIQHFNPADNPTPFPIGDYGRAYGTFGQPNPFGALMGMSLAAAFALSIYTSRSTRPPLMAAVAVLTLGLAASGSRGALVAAGAGIAVSCVLAYTHPMRSGSREKLLRPIAAALGMVWLGLLPFLSNGTLLARSTLHAGNTELARNTPIAEGTPLGKSTPVGSFGEARAPVDSAAQRLIGYRVALDMIRDHPLLGVGPATYPQAIERYAPAELDECYRSTHVHNLFLQIWVESGIVTLLAFVCGLGTVALRSISRLGRDRYAHCAFAVLVVFAVHNLVDVTLVHGLQLLLGFFLALPFVGNDTTGARSHSVAEPAP